MVSRCPSCGSPTPEDEKVCPSCGWDFVARKRTKLDSSGPAPKTPPAAPSTPPAQPAAGGFALPPARNLNQARTEEPMGLKPLPTLEPRSSSGPAEGENPFTLPMARGVPAPEAPPKREPVPDKPLPAPPAPAAPPKDGLGARLFRSLRGEPAKPVKPAAPAPAERELPDAPDAPEKKGFSLPPARIIEAEEPALPERRAREEEVVEKAPLAPVEAAPPRPAPAPEPLPEPSARVEDEEEPVSAPPAAAALLPSSARESVPPPPVRSAPSAAARPKPSAAALPAAEAPSPSESRKSMVMIAAIAGAALGTVSVLAVYLLMRSDTAPVSGAIASPFGRPGATPAARPAFPVAPGAPGATAAPAPSVPAPAAALKPLQSPRPLLEAPRSAAVAASAAAAGPIVSPAPAPAAAQVPARVPAPATASERPAATFGNVPRLVVAGEASEPKPAALKPAASAPAAEEHRARKPKGPRWVFEGVVFDLLTARGVFGASLTFVDPDGNVVGETDSGPAGRYKISLPPGSGYKLKISHGDYTDRYIDEGDGATSSLRDATPEERRMLMSAAARSNPWTGNPAKPSHRDLALIPKTPEEP